MRVDDRSAAHGEQPHGMTVRYRGLALLAIVPVFEIPAVIRYINVERM